MGGVLEARAARGGHHGERSFLITFDSAVALPQVTLRAASEIADEHAIGASLGDVLRDILQIGALSRLFVDTKMLQLPVHTTGTGGKMSGKLGRFALFGSALMLIAGAGAVLSGCSRNPSSADYLKGLQKAAVQGSLAHIGNIDASTQCPTCSSAQIEFAKAMVAAEKGMEGTCRTLPTAESNYRYIEQSLSREDLAADADYQDFIQHRTCVVARKYQECTEPDVRNLSIGDESGPAGALVSAIDECRKFNPLEADEILDRAIAREAQAVSFDILASDWNHASPEVKVYEALPRSNKERVAQWRSAIAKEEAAEHSLPPRFVRSEETGSKATR